jgi:iduronate 2-sulfatase
MLFSAPGISGGGRIRSPTEFVDIYPTLCELTGLDIPPHCEGASLVPLLRDPSHPGKPAAFSQYPRGSRMGYSMRSGSWRYTEWINRKTGKVEARELYDHATGPLTDRNLADAPEHEETVRGLSAMLDRGQGWKKFQQAGRMLSPRGEP